MSHGDPFSRRDPPEFFKCVAPWKRGRKEGRELAAPMAPVQTIKHGVGTTGSAETSRPSLRDGVTIYTRSSRGTAFLPPSPAVRHRQLGISTGMPEPRDFIVASGSFVRAGQPALRPNAPTASRTRRP